MRAQILSQAERFYYSRIRLAGLPSHCVGERLNKSQIAWLPYAVGVAVQLTNQPVNHGRSVVHLKKDDKEENLFTILHEPYKFVNVHLKKNY